MIFLFSLPPLGPVPKHCFGALDGIYKRKDTPTDLLLQETEISAIFELAERKNDDVTVLAIYVVTALPQTGISLINITQSECH